MGWVCRSYIYVEPFSIISGCTLERHLEPTCDICQDANENRLSKFPTLSHVIVHCLLVLFSFYFSIWNWSWAENEICELETNMDYPYFCLFKVFGASWIMTTGCMWVSDLVAVVALPFSVWLPWCFFLSFLVFSLKKLSGVSNGVVCLFSHPECA